MGEIVAQYDKIHMFDVTLSETEKYRESDGYRAGEKAVLATTEFGQIGMTICYDIRFPGLYRKVAFGIRVLFKVGEARVPRRPMPFAFVAAEKGGKQPGERATKWRKREERARQRGRSAKR